MAAPQCPVCLDCNSLVAAATNKGSEEVNAVKSELKKSQTENEESLAAIALLKKQLLEKINELAKANAKIAELEAILKQLKVDVNKLIGMWEPPPNPGEHIIFTLDDVKKKAK
jgi:hypothetical protein